MQKIKKSNQSQGTLSSLQQQQTNLNKSKQNQRKSTVILHLLDNKIDLNEIIINISDTQYSVVPQVAEQLDWKIQRKNDAVDWDVWWTDSAIMPDVLFKMHFFQKINHYPGIHIISRKNLLGLNLMAMRQRFPNEYNFFPLTWMLPSQYPQFRIYYQTMKKSKDKVFIAKPEAQCQGRGIFLTKNIEDLANGNRYVVQKYINKPLLIDNLKFDFRIYVLLAGTQPLRIYLFEEGLARFATQNYKQPTNFNMSDTYMHLTNYAINKHNPKFIFNQSSKNMNVGHKRSLSNIYSILQKMGHDISKLKQRIKDLIIKTFITGIPLISHQYKYCQPQQYSGNMCFHILGFDILLTENLDPILLQVNHTPSFTTDTPLDNYIKHKLIKDTLVLMNINQETKRQLFQKAKQCNIQRLYTGKRRIFLGQQKIKEIERVQRERDLYEQLHMGGFEKIHPTKDQQLNKKYAFMIEESTKLYLQQNTFRCRALKQQKIIMKNEQNKRKNLNMNNQLNNPIDTTKIKKSSQILNNKIIRNLSAKVSRLKKEKPILNNQFKLFTRPNIQIEESEKLIENFKMASSTANYFEKSSLLNLNEKQKKDYKKSFVTYNNKNHQKFKFNISLKSNQSEKKEKMSKAGFFLKPKIYNLNSQQLKNKSLMLEEKPITIATYRHKNSFIPLSLKQFLFSNYDIK